MDGKPMTISMTEAELTLYQSGQRRGHAECLQQLSGQLKGAAGAYFEKKTGGDDMIGNALEAFAKQLDEPAIQAAKEQQSLLDRWCAIRTIDDRSVFERLKAAANGALAGWRGR